MSKNYDFMTGKTGGFNNNEDTANEEWIYITPNVEKFKNIISKDSEDGTKASDISDDLAIIKSLVAQTVILGKGENGQAKDTEIGNMVEAIDSIGRTKKRLGTINLEAEIKKFNDNLERAKVKAIRKQLRAAAESFNKMKKVKEIKHVPAGSRGSYSWPAHDYPVYDEITYDAGIYAWDTFLDMRTDRLFKELEDRERKYGITLISQDLKDSMVRPEDT